MTRLPAGKATDFTWSCSSAGRLHDWSRLVLNFDYSHSVFPKSSACLRQEVRQSLFLSWSTTGQFCLEIDHWRALFGRSHLPWSATASSRQRYSGGWSSPRYCLQWTWMALSPGRPSSNLTNVTTLLYSTGKLACLYRYMKRQALALWSRTCHWLPHHHPRPHLDH